MFNIAQQVATLATCPRANGGAVIATDHLEIVSTGYNGAPPDVPHCKDVGCHMIDNHCARTMHAEANAIIQVARISGAKTRGRLMFCTHFPCPWCARMIVQAKIQSVYYLNDQIGSYVESDRNFVRQLFNDGNVKLYKCDEGGNVL